jgi:hypothetical protein
MFGDFANGQDPRVNATPLIFFFSCFHILILVFIDDTPLRHPMRGFLLRSATVNFLTQLSALKLLARSKKNIILRY